MGAKKEVWILRNSLISHSVLLTRRLEQATVLEFGLIFLSIKCKFCKWIIKKILWPSVSSCIILKKFRVVKFCICIAKRELLNSRRKKECRYLVGVVLTPERKHLQWVNRHIDWQWPDDCTDSFPQFFWIGWSWSSLPSQQRADYISGRFGEY